MNDSIELYRQSLEIYYNIHNEVFERYKSNNVDLDFYVIEGPDKSGKTTFIRTVWEGKSVAVFKENMSKNKEVYKQIMDYALQRVENVHKLLSEGVLNKRTVIYDRYIYSTIVYQILYPVIIGKNIMPSMKNTLFLVEDLIRFVFSTCQYILPHTIVYLYELAVETAVYKAIANAWELSHDRDLLIKIYNDIFNRDRIKGVRIIKGRKEATALYEQIQSKSQ